MSRFDLSRQKRNVSMLINEPDVVLPSFGGWTCIQFEGPRTGGLMGQIPRHVGDIGGSDEVGGVAIWHPVSRAGHIDNTIHHYI